MLDKRDADPSATVFSIRSWLAEQLACPVHELVQVAPAATEQETFETWLFARTGTDVHGAVVITHARLGIRGVTAVWGADGMARTAIGADDIVRW